MIKNSAIKRIILATLVLCILLIIYFFPTNELEITESLSYIDQKQMPIFLIDSENYVARTTIIQKNDTTEEIIEEIIDALTIGGSKSNYIPENFKAIIPKNTKLIDYELKDKILKLDFSKELLNIDANTEEKLIESLIYSLTEIDGIEKLMLFVEGTQLTKLPHSNQKLPTILDKNYGINKVYNLDSVKDTTKTTTYYLSKNNDYYYYVPVTDVTNTDIAHVEIIIDNLKSTPIYHSNLISYLQASSNLLSYELLENSINLSFDNHLIANLHQADILEEIKYAIALSIRDTYGIDKTIFTIAGVEESSIEIN